MSAPRGYYAVLELDSETAGLQDIRKKYKKLSLLWHPDKNVGKSQAEIDEAARRFEAISEAYQVLSDPQKRREYDEMLAGRRKTPQQEAEDRSAAMQAEADARQARAQARRHERSTESYGRKPRTGYDTADSSHAMPRFYASAQNPFRAFRSEPVRINPYEALVTIALVLAIQEGLRRQREAAIRLHVFGHMMSAVFMCNMMHNTYVHFQPVRIR